MSESAPSNSTIDRRRNATARLKRGALALLLFASLGYLVAIVRRDLDGFFLALNSLNSALLIAATFSASAMMLLKALYHYDLCRAIGARNTSAEVILPAYAIAQVVRYLPGKVWGIVYQTARLSDITAAQVITANILQMLHTNFLAIGVIVATLGYLIFDRVWLLFLPALFLILIEILHRRPIIEKFVVSTINRLLRRQDPSALNVGPRPWRGTLILGLEWIFYYLMWWILLLPATFNETLGPATWYAAASLLAILAFVIPGGIGVREAIFVTLAAPNTEGAAHLVVLAAAVRLILIAAELACIPAARLLGRRLDHFVP